MCQKGPFPSMPPSIGNWDVWMRTVENLSGVARYMTLCRLDRGDTSIGLFYSLHYDLVFKIQGVDRDFLASGVMAHR